jgi:protein-S-isoprenylcysteine O-methyltransferase Ste14
MPVILRTALFTLLVPGTVVGLVPWLILRGTGGVEIAEGALPFLGFGLIGLGLVVYLRCAYDFTFAGRGTPFPLDPPREFVARGLYRYTRNPMYLGFAGLVVGEALVFGSWWLVVYAGLLCVVWHLFVVRHEEPDLRRRFGESYERYCGEVSRWLPRAPRRGPRA